MSDDSERNSLNSNDSEHNKMRFSWADIIWFGVLPGLGNFRAAYAFSGLPLHYRDSGWDLWNLGLSFTFANVIRTIFVSPSLAFYGPWMAAPLSVVMILLSVPMVIMPDSQWAVTLGVIAFAMCMFADATQALISSRIIDDKARQYASRVSTLSFTIGYGTAPCFGGLIYDLGGWKACAMWQLAVLVAEAFLFWTSSWIWDDFRRWRHASRASQQRPSIQQGATTAVVPFDAPDDTSQLPEKLPYLPHDLYWPAAMVALSHGINHFAYAFEYQCYALYFRDMFGWTSALWSGAAQMSGDIVGAWALVMIPKLQAYFRCTGSTDNCLCRLFAAPYHISGMLIFWTMLHLAITSSNFLIAVAAQVIMGTVFVFHYQFNIEMVSMYADGDDRTFKNMQFVSAIAFNVAYGAGGVAALWSYENLGPLAPFQIGAASTCFTCVVYTFYYMMRVGLPKSLKDFEKQRAIKKGRSRSSGTGDTCQAGAVLDGDGMAMQTGEAQLKSTKRMEEDSTISNLIIGPMTLFARVSALLLDCGLAEQSSDENVVSRGRRLASDLGLEFVSVLAVVEKAELLVYGTRRPAPVATVSDSGSTETRALTTTPSTNGRNTATSIGSNTATPPLPPPSP
eukprot:gnl/MRDRNA2_/MRDRNA2_57714_c0_seq1.p1 gnl/MRDRNA2_/MRDRNA2_57714_c0~~gnl/MRDRNA2_/MRDRNA2_57714_c0_seq1.p1  ORF type:complete len:622 (-),score=63.39 gnl/MRDRNA2_/MRDRNA2_57714_c0_seq1:150-2015(-)